MLLFGNLIPAFGPLAWTLAAIAVFAVLGPLLDRVIFPEKAPGPEYIPSVGQSFHSATEGFTQRIVRRENGLLWSELTMAPFAPGPPAHIHTTFAEHFRVVSGTVSLRVADKVLQLGPGEDYLVPAGIPHQPFNATSEPAVVYGTAAEFALPERFGIFLTQAYGFMDAQPENARPPRVLLQMSRFAPAFDTWLAGPPVALQRAAYWVLSPIARLIGYRSYYPEYAPTRNLSNASPTPHVNLLGGSPRTPQNRAS